MKKFYLLSILVISLTACSKQEDTIFLIPNAELELASDSGMQSQMVADTLYITYNGAKYFPVQLNLDGLSQDMFINGVPNVTADWTTNYWYTMVDGLYMWSSLYNLLDSSYNQNFTYATASETRLTSIPDVAELDEVMNISGQYMRNGDLGPVPTTYFNKDLRTRQMMALNPEMVGEVIEITADVFIGEDGISTTESMYIKFVN